MPHHPVVKFKKDPRVVYDASAKIKNYPSLNECMYRGPLLLENLRRLLLDFRFYKIVLIADIQRAFFRNWSNERIRPQLCSFLMV